MRTPAFLASPPQGFANALPTSPQSSRPMLFPMTTTSNLASATELRLDDLEGLRGTIITPSDPQYEAARAVYNGATDRRPLAIVPCADVADVMICVAYARDNVLPLAIRGGGHHGGGFAVWYDALVIDLSGLRSTSVDPVAGTVRVDGGCVWGDVDHVTGAFGMALPSGFMSTTRVGGLTLGGGIGYLTRRFGLTIDNLVSADVVLADGRFVTASADSHSDLLGAARRLRQLRRRHLVQVPLPSNR
jgi:FAD/FMN-containing dehydrogenase